MNGRDSISSLSAIHKSAVTCDFQQCGILTSVDSDQHVQPPFSLETPNDAQSVT